MEVFDSDRVSCNSLEDDVIKSGCLLKYNVYYGVFKSFDAKMNAHIFRQNSFRYGIRNKL